MEVISPDDPGSLWEALKESKVVKKALNLDKYQADVKYLVHLWPKLTVSLTVGTCADTMSYYVLQIPGNKPSNCSI